MKKLLTITFGCALMLALSACQKPLHSSENNSSTAITSSETSGLVSTPISVSEPQTTYSVVFLNYDNSLLYEATGIERGKPAIYRGPTPVRPETDEYKYEFIGWDKNITAIYSDLAVIAQYTATKKESQVPTIPPMVESVYETEENPNGMELAFAGIFEDKYYAYFFDLGVVNRTPVYSSASVTVTDTIIETTFKFEKCRSEVLTRGMTTATQAIHTDSTTTGFSIKPEIELGSVTIKPGSFDHHWTHEDTVVKERSENNEESYTTSYSEGYEVKAVLSKENGYKTGYSYRVSFFETVRCYGVLLYNFEDGKYSYFYNTLLDTAYLSFKLEESSNSRGEFKYDINAGLNFDVDAAIEIAKNEEYKFDKRVRVDNQNGTEDFFNVYLDNNGEFVGKKPAVPVNGGKHFLGYFSKKELGQGDCYIDSNMKVVKPIIANINLFAHWADPSHSVTNHEGGDDNVYKSKGNNESNWESIWKGESKAFSSGFKTEEAIDAVKGGYKYVQVKIRMDTYEEVDGWEWVSFRTRKNDSFFCDLQIFKISVLTKTWKSVIFNFTFDASYLTDSTITYQIAYGVSGNNTNEWKRGYTTTSMTLVKEAITPYAEETIDGGPYSL